MREGRFVGSIKIPPRAGIGCISTKVKSKRFFIGWAERYSTDQATASRLVI